MAPLSLCSGWADEPKAGAHAGRPHELGAWQCKRRALLAVEIGHTSGLVFFLFPILVMEEQLLALPEGCSLPGRCLYLLPLPTQLGPLPTSNWCVLPPCPC